MSNTNGIYNRLITDMDMSKMTPHFSEICRDTLSEYLKDVHLSDSMCVRTFLLKDGVLDIEYNTTEYTFDNTCVVVGINKLDEERHCYNTRIMIWCSSLEMGAIIMYNTITKTVITAKCTNTYFEEDGLYHEIKL